MLNRKHFLILLLFIVAIGTISSVSADSNATDEISYAESNDEIAIEDTNNLIADELDGESEDTNNTDGTEVGNTPDTIGDANNTTESENEYDSLISVKQSGKYLNDKTFTITLTDLNGNPLKNKRLSQGT